MWTLLERFSPVRRVVPADREPWLHETPLDVTVTHARSYHDRFLRRAAARGSCRLENG
jgi:hypothetical protein